MQKTKIDWADQTWNPVTGCLHSCPFCYAKKQVSRFKGNYKEVLVDRNIHAIEVQRTRTTKEGKIIKAPYPFGFEPTFHKYRLEEPQLEKRPQNIFVCSMADLFGDWVPDEWIESVIKACKKAPQHRYLFLTKYYKRYEYLVSKHILPAILNPNYLFGHSITTQKDADGYFDWQFHSHNDFKENYWINRFISVEPIQEKINLSLNWFRTDWVIIGAETGNRKGKVIPKREWIEDIVNQCRKRVTPIFMKSNLADIWKEPLIQEYPWKEAA